MTRPVLRVDGLRLSVVGNLLFHDLSFEVPPSGIVGIMGPVGTGKSSLLKWICGTGDPAIYVGESRSVEYFYGPMKDGNRPRLLGQKAANSFEETMIMLNALLRPNPPLICLDEITARLSDRERATVIDRVMMISQSRAVLFVSHNQLEVESITDSVMLLAGGMLQEHTPTTEFFEKPRSDAGAQFVRTGGVALPRIGTPARHLRSDLRGVPDGMRLAGDQGGQRGVVRFLIDEKLCVIDQHNADAENILNDPKALIDAGISSVIHVSDGLPEHLGKLEEAGIYEDWLRIPTGPDVPMAEYMRRCERINNRIKSSPAVLIVDHSSAFGSYRAAVMQMAYLGLSAERACEVLKDIVGADNLSVSDEQVLWDLELAIDLEGDTHSALFEDETPALRFASSRTEPLVSAADNRLIRSNT